jgi:16S rRNA (adenine1518-N6/adenine1519-N6)-dimethyltransferase
LRTGGRLGQNFLVDLDLRDRVVEAAGVEPDDQVLEIGAGTGTLTSELVRRARRVVAVEIDRRLLTALRAAAPEAEVVHADILRLDLAKYFPAGGEVVVGNIPYYLTGMLMPRLLEREPRPKRISLVVQKEVARRWCGLDGWSLATVAVQTFAVPRLELELPPEAFDPVPKVSSALVVMEVRPAPAVHVSNLGAFFRFVEAVFQLRRKQLRTSLARVGGVSPDETARRLHQVGVDATRRPETLSLAEWERVFSVLTA